MPFNWTPLRLHRLAQAVRAFNGAITNKAKEMVRSGAFIDMDDALSYLPPKKTTAEIKERVNTVNDFRRIVGYRGDRFRGRPSELDRVLKSVNPKALDFNEELGYTTTNYTVKEYKLRKRRIERETRRAEQCFKAMYPSYEGMSPAEQATAMAGAGMNVGEVGEVEADFDSGVDQATLDQWRRQDSYRQDVRDSIQNQVKEFMAVWQDPMNFHHAMGNYDAVVNAVDWLESHRPDEMWKMLNSGSDEIQPSWLYINTKVTAYQSIPIEVRHNRTVMFVLNNARSAGWQG